MADLSSENIIFQFQVPVEHAEEDTKSESGELELQHGMERSANGRDRMANGLEVEAMDEDGLHTEKCGVGLWIIRSKTVTPHTTIEQSNQVLLDVERMLVDDKGVAGKYSSAWHCIHPDSKLTCCMTVPRIPSRCSADSDKDVQARLRRSTSLSLQPFD